jgi:hypothetical protein
MYDNFLMGLGPFFVYLTSGLASTFSCTLYHDFTHPYIIILVFTRKLYVFHKAIGHQKFSTNNKNT